MELKDRPPGESSESGAEGRREAQDSKRNMRIVIRQLCKAPGFTLTAVLMLALGIGATTAVFSLLQGILLRPLPFRDADRLVLVGDHLGGNPGISVTARERSEERRVGKECRSRWSRCH